MTDKENFGLDKLGDIKEGRRSIGADVPVLVYRLNLYALRQTLKDKLGEKAARALLRESGKKAGDAFARGALDLSSPFPLFCAELTTKLIGFKIGVLNFENTDYEDLCFTVTLSEDLACSGLCDSGETVCSFDEGFIEGLFGAYTGKDFLAKEIACWASGGKTCRFEVSVI